MSLAAALRLRAGKGSVSLADGQCVGRPTSLDQQFVDFDGVRYHVTSTEKKSVLLLSMEWRCIQQLDSFGAQEVLAREYGSALLPKNQTEPEYDVSLLIDLEQLPRDPGTPGPVQAFTHKLSSARTIQRKDQRSSESMHCLGETPWRHPSNALSLPRSNSRLTLLNLAPTLPTL